MLTLAVCLEPDGPSGVKWAATPSVVESCSVIAASIPCSAIGLNCAHAGANPQRSEPKFSCVANVLKALITFEKFTPCIT